MTDIRFQQEHIIEPYYEKDESFSQAGTLFP
jgi:hypothetical protein